ncbi:hypothetical protein [Hungatella hathewayi]|uniref:hypothetical protein n=1 Tax=Hungatella hathewayi TaxID=154046 RepID=UPI002A7F17F3|nr:hypothetical protein [Hungatella hathewayi]
MEFTPYIRFNGSCREAVEFYAKAFGAEQLLRYGDGPLRHRMADECPERTVTVRPFAAGDKALCKCGG